MRAASKVAALYAAAVGSTFVWFYVVQGVREMGLYLLLLVMNLPASAAMVPVGESVAQALCMAANCALILTVGAVLAKRR